MENPVRTVTLHAEQYAAARAEERRLQREFEKAGGSVGLFEGVVSYQQIRALEEAGKNRKYLARTRERSSTTGGSARTSETDRLGYSTVLRIDFPRRGAHGAAESGPAIPALSAPGLFGTPSVRWKSYDTLGFRIARTRK